MKSTAERLSTHRQDSSDRMLLKKKTRVRKYLGIGSLAVAALFLWNPDLAIVDVLPDFLGYLILLFGLSQLRDLNGYLDTAYSRFFRMAGIAFLKPVALLFTAGVLAPSEQPDTLLLFTFVFCVLDFLLLFPAWNVFFDGISRLTLSNPSETGFMAEQETRFSRFRRSVRTKLNLPIRESPVMRSRFDRVRKLTMAFLVMKSVLAVLPELSALAADVEIRSVCLYDFIGLLRVAAALPVFVAGLCWLISVIRFVSAVKKEKALLEMAKEKYRSEVLTNEAIFVKRHLKVAFFFLALALLFLFELRMTVGVPVEIDGPVIDVTVNFLPDVGFGIFLCLAVMLMGRHVKGWKPIFLTALPFAVSSVFANYFEYQFTWYYNAGAIFRNEKAGAAFTRAVIFKSAEQLLLLLLLFFLFRMLYSVIVSYTGLSISPENSHHPGEQIRKVHLELKRKLLVAGLLALPAVISNHLCLSLSYYEMPGGILEWFFLVALLFDALFAFFFYRAVRDIYEQVEYRFMLS